MVLTVIHVCVCRHLGGLGSLVQLGSLHQSFCRHVLVQNTVDEWRNGCKNQVEQDKDPGVGHDAPRETTKELIPEQ